MGYQTSQTVAAEDRRRTEVGGSPRDKHQGGMDFLVVLVQGKVKAIGQL